MRYVKAIVYSIFFCMCMGTALVVGTWYGTSIFSTMQHWLSTKKQTTQRDSQKFSMERLVDTDKIIPVAIIGSGPAGLSAALYTARGGLHTVVFEGSLPGGQLMETSVVENWPGRPKILGPDVIKSLHTQAHDFGVYFIRDSVTSVDTSSWPYTLKTAQGLTVRALTIVIATGSTPRGLRETGYAPGEREYWGKGVTACAVCDAPLYKDAAVVVVGGGDSAAEEALQLAQYARSITILVRGDKMRASPAMQERLRAYQNIHVSYNTTITAIKGDGAHVNGIDVMANGKAEAMVVTGVFLATGHTPNSKIFEGIVAMKNGYITTEGSAQKTSVDGIFAAGDVADTVYRQAGVAAGCGIKAGLDALEFLRTVGFDTQRIGVQKLFIPEVVGNRTTVHELASVQELEKLMKAGTPVLLDFFTQHCPTCAQMLIAVEQIAAQYKDELVVFKVAVEKMPELVQRLAISAAPTVVLLHQGNVALRVHELVPYRTLAQMVETALHGNAA